MKVLSESVSFKSKQRGMASVIGVMFLMTAVMWMWLEYFQLKDDKKSVSAAEESGRHLQTMSFSVMKLISETGLATAPGTYVGTNWLKGPSCTGGTAASEFLDCLFNNNNFFGDSYSTVVTVNAGTGVVTAVITVPWPTYREEINPNMASRMRRAAASSLSGSTPVAQTFADYQLDRINQTVVATVSTSVSTDIWYRTDGSNQMNADANLGGNSIYNVVNLFGGATATASLTDNINLGSAVNIAGVLTLNNSLGSGLANSSKLVIEGFDNTGESISAAGDISTQQDLIAVGNLFANQGDFLNRVTIGDAAGGDSSIGFRQYAPGDNRNILVTGDDGDLYVENGNNDATIIADKVYVESLNRYASQGVYNITMAQHQSVVEKPVCTSPLIPQVFMSMAGIAQSPGRPIAVFDVIAIDLGSSWQVDVRLSTDGPNETPDSLINSRVLVITKCS